MLKGLIGKKVGMTQIFDEAGAAIPVTLIEAGPCYVTQIRNKEIDGYSAVQLGFEEAKPKRLTGGQIGHLKRNELPPLRFLREFRVKDPAIKEGQEIKVDIFEVGDRVDVIGTSKGRGFAGAVKRYGFRGGPKTHGQSDRWRAPGSLGQSSYPSRVFKGLSMAGRMGNKKETRSSSIIIKIDTEKNLLFVKGSVPGGPHSLVEIKRIS